MSDNRRLRNQFTRYIIDSLLFNSDDEFESHQSKKRKTDKSEESVACHYKNFKSATYNLLCKKKLLKRKFLLSQIKNDLRSAPSKVPKIVENSTRNNNKTLEAEKTMIRKQNEIQLLFSKVYHKVKSLEVENNKPNVPETSFSSKEETTFAEEKKELKDLKREIRKIVHNKIIPKFYVLSQQKNLPPLQDSKNEKISNGEENKKNCKNNFKRNNQYGVEPDDSDNFKEKIVIKDCFVKIEKMPVLDRLLPINSSKTDWEPNICDLCEPKSLFLSKDALLKHVNKEHVKCSCESKIKHLPMNYKEVNETNFNECLKQLANKTVLGVIKGVSLSNPKNIIAHQAWFKHAEKNS